MAEKEIKKTGNESLTKLLEGLEGFSSTKMVVGTPIVVDGCTLIPLNDVQYGLGVGGGKSANAGGMGAKVSPSAVLVVQNGAVKLVNIKNQDTVTKLLDMVPDLVDKITGMKVKTTQNVDDKVDEILNENKE